MVAIPDPELAATLDRAAAVVPASGVVTLDQVAPVVVVVAILGQAVPAVCQHPVNLGQDVPAKAAESGALAGRVDRERLDGLAGRAGLRVILGQDVPVVLRANLGQDKLVCCCLGEVPAVGRNYTKRRWIRGLMPYGFYSPSGYGGCLEIQSL